MSELVVLCPFCKKMGDKSVVYTNGGSTTQLLGYEGDFWDMEGIRHNHNPNRLSTGYRCSKGHFYTKHYWYPCPALDCSYTEQEEYYEEGNPPKRDPVGWADPRASFGSVEWDNEK